MKARTLIRQVVRNRGHCCPVAIVSKSLPGPSDARARIDDYQGSTAKLGRRAIELTPEPFGRETVTAETPSANLKPREHSQR